MYSLQEEMVSMGFYPSFYCKTPTRGQQFSPHLTTSNFFVSNCSGIDSNSQGILLMDLKHGEICSRASSNVLP